MRFRFNQVHGIDTQTGAIVQVEATRTHTGGKETDAEVVLSLFNDADDCGYHTTLSASQAKELIKRLQSLYEGIKAYNEELHDAKSITEK
jgi:hypothetical protein